MFLQITPFYAALLALLFLALRTNVTIERAKSGISILTGDNMVLAEKSRRFGNFIETVPLLLILMALVEMAVAPNWMLHTIGILLLASRVLHPFGLNHKVGKHPIRILAGVMTMLSTLIAAFFILWQSFA